MTNVHLLLRSLIIYAVCLPLAVFLGYALSNPLDYGTLISVGGVLALLIVPVLLRIHYPLMLLSWSMPAVIFILPGRPQLWIVATGLSFIISLSQRILSKHVQPVQSPALTRPLLFLAAVVLATALLSGGMGFRVFGSTNFGGKRYFLIASAIVGYFALTARKIPLDRAKLYVALFLLGGTTSVIGDLFAITDPALQFIFWLFPPNFISPEGIEFGTTRLGGTACAALAIFSWMLAQNGLRDILLGHRPWRILALATLGGIGLLGGFRSTAMFFLGIFLFQFFLEGLHRTKLLPLLALVLVAVFAVTLPFVAQLPPAVQRSLAFLPVPIDPMVRSEVEGSSDWRLTMWKSLLPQVPNYFWLGKGLAMTAEDFELAQKVSANNAAFEEQWAATLASDFHNGPLSVIIPFGVWGALAFLWLLGAGFGALAANFRYGDPALRNVNAFLLASFITHTLMFFFIVGGFYGDMLQFTGLIGLSVGLNGGVARKLAPGDRSAA